VRDQEVAHLAVAADHVPDTGTNVMILLPLSSKKIGRFRQKQTIFFTKNWPKSPKTSDKNIAYLLNHRNLSDSMNWNNHVCTGLV
jgi:hypothetical protein